MVETSASSKPDERLYPTRQPLFGFGRTITLCVLNGIGRFCFGVRRKSSSWRFVGNRSACNLSCQILLHLAFTRESGFNPLANNAF